MEYKNPLTVSLERSFIAGTGDLAAFHNRLSSIALSFYSVAAVGHKLLSTSGNMR